MSTQQPLSLTFLRSTTARRLGLKPERQQTVREESGIIGTRTNAVPGSLAAALDAGVVTAASPEGLPILVGGTNHDTLFELDERDGQFAPSTRVFEEVFAWQWGCVAPAFKHVVPPQTDPTLVSFATFSTGSISFDAIRESQIEELRPTLRARFCEGFEEDADESFNAALTRPVTTDELRSHAAFREIFPPDDDNSPAPNGFSAISDTPDVANDNPVGRVIISYRHQEFGANRITFDDWQCAVHTVHGVMRAYGWRKARFWSDARLRQYKRVMAANTGEKVDHKMPWAELGIAPYRFGPVVVLNLAMKASISDRFWLTVERQTGARFYGTWLSDDTGDLFMYLLSNDLDMYSRSIVTSVSTSQMLSWPQDREDILSAEWNELDVDDVEEAILLLWEADTFEAREDFVDEELAEVYIAPKGKTLQWCGDLEAVVDPPSLRSVFGQLGSLSRDISLRVVETERTVGETRIVNAMFDMHVNGKKTYLAKRLYVDSDGEIRARSVPRLVDEDYLDRLLTFKGVRSLDLERKPPYWLVAGAASCQAEERGAG